MQIIIPYIEACNQFLDHTPFIFFSLDWPFGSVTADKWVPIVEVPVSNLKFFLSEKKHEGFSILGLEQTTNSISIDQFSFPKKTVCQKRKTLIHGTKKLSLSLPRVFGLLLGSDSGSRERGNPGGHNPLLGRLRGDSSAWCCSFSQCPCEWCHRSLGVHSAAQIRCFLMNQFRFIFLMDGCRRYSLSLYHDLSCLFADSREYFMY